MVIPGWPKQQNQTDVPINALTENTEVSMISEDGIRPAGPLRICMHLFEKHGFLRMIEIWKCAHCMTKHFHENRY